jgi:DNA-binding response OmpR family regulator
MVVDDDPGFREFVRKVAQGCGYQVQLIPDAGAVETEYAGGRPDLILLDLQMPGTDGVECLRVLADLGCTAPILVMSGFDAKVIDTVRRLGAARGLQMGPVLIKPIGLTELRGILSTFKQGLASHVG